MPKNKLDSMNLKTILIHLKKRLVKYEVVVDSEHNETVIIFEIERYKNRVFNTKTGKQIK